MTGANDALDRVLRMVAEGRLSAEEAAPIIEALQLPKHAAPPPAGESDKPRGGPGNGPPRFARIEVQEGGRRVVDLRVPISLGRLALARIPGLSAEQVAEVEAAVALGAGGPLLNVQDEDGDGVRIVLE
jgi:hypothetical protein